jgi:hypothetical protein
VNKLRFMQRATEAQVNSPSVDKISQSLERWSLSTFDAALVHKSADESSRLTDISVVARRSYGGANPYIEQVTATIERPRKKAKRSSN